mgnify:CR=1 FL=1|tara:strand:+ start:177 stop:329 length:153 start_codon:yes stop_codon:yes gene_type:complete
MASPLHNAPRRAAEATRYAVRIAFYRAVADGRVAHTAAAYQAFKAAYNLN